MTIPVGDFLRFEDWVTVGAGGAAPAFDGAWVNFGGTDGQGVANQVAQFRRTPDGEVRFRGIVKSGVIGTSIFTLPAGYRPPSLHRFGVVSNGAFGGVNVRTDGQVIAISGSNAYVVLDQVRFALS